jgi:hypothetical protein
MTVIPPRASVEAERPEPVAPPAPPPERPAPPRAPVALSPRRISPERIVIGILLAAAGVAWLLDEVGFSVPWALAPAAGVVVIGIALIVAARTRDGHAPLVVWGGILLAVALLVAVVRPVGGPVGDRFLTPTATQWPVATSLTAGNLTIDLQQNALPANGRLTADVTAGRVVLHLPNGPRAERVQVIAHVGMGQIKVDGVEVRNGMALDWTSPDPAAIIVDVHVGTGQLEVDHG